MSLTRRSLLGVVAGLAAAACGPRRQRRAGSPPPDTGALAAAVDAERGLLADYDRVIAASDAAAAGQLTVARQRHAEHLRELLNLAVSSSASASPTTATGTALPVSLRSSAASLRSAAVSAQDGRTAALLASVAAEHSADASVNS